MKLVFGCQSTGAYGGRRTEFKEFFYRKISGPEELVPDTDEFHNSK